MIFNCDHINRRRAWAAGSVTGLLLLFASGVPAWADTGSPSVPLLPPTTQQQKSLLIQMQDAFTKIAQTVEPTVVNIKAERLSTDAASDGPLAPPAPAPKNGLPFSPNTPRRSLATGSGVIVRGDGYILTNDHVVEGATGGVVTVTLYDGREFKGKIFRDKSSDLAVVKIEPGTAPLPVATFADSSAVIPGQWAIAVGSPFDLQNTVTVGIISATGRHQEIPGDSPGSGRYYPDLIQTDAAINPGNSGGPLFNIDGKVVGINVAIESPVEGSAGVGFAIPSDIAQQIITSLIQRGKVTRGFLGLAPDDLTPALQQQYGQKDGAFVRDVQLSSPAGKAGLQAADIITSFDGKPIKDEIDLRMAIAATPPGKPVAIRYVRDGSPGQTTAVIASVPATPTDDTPSLPASTAPNKVRLGISVRDITPRDRQSMRLPTGTSGVVVANVVPGSPAESAGLSSNAMAGGVVLQKLNETIVNTKDDFEKAAASLSPSASTATLVVLYVMNGNVHQTAVTLRL